MCQLCPRTMSGGPTIQNCATCRRGMCRRHIEWDGNAYRCRRCLRNTRKEGIARADVRK